MYELIDKVHRCADCPIRRRAIAQPYSIYARIHRWHCTWWPGWKSYQAQLRERTAQQARARLIQQDTAQNGEMAQ